MALIASSCTIPFTTSNPSPQAIHSPTELKYILIGKYGEIGQGIGIFFCDPDVYPIAREGQEQENAQAQFDSLRQETEIFNTILKHSGLEGIAEFSAEQKMNIYQEYKKLKAILLDPAGELYAFQLTVTDENGNGFLVAGTIDQYGKIKEKSKEVTIATCPICLAEGTLIDTPDGGKPVEVLQVGDQVWSTDLSGKRVPAVIISFSLSKVPLYFEMVRLSLDDGRMLLASPGHPLVDGRLLGDLKVGDTVDGAVVMRVELTSNQTLHTYDILPAGGNGLYWANGILLKSTLLKK
jgi:hypothetical protein